MTFNVHIPEVWPQVPIFPGCYDVLLLLPPMCHSHIALWPGYNCLSTENFHNPEPENVLLAGFSPPEL